MPTWIALALGTFASEDLTTIAAGVLAGEGRLAPAVAVLACGTGIYLGDLGLWAIGRFLGGATLVHRRIARLIHPASGRRVNDWIERHPFAAIAGSRFTPGARLPLYLAAGACGVSFTMFARWSAVAVALWTPVVIAVSAVVGHRLTDWLAAGRLGVVLSAAVVLVVWRSVLALASRRTRQRLVAGLSRVWRWEFWPMWLFYAPVALWTSCLAWRHGGYRTLTAANPGLPDGGVVGESKFAILRALPEEWTIPAALIEPGSPIERLERLQAAVRECGWTYPIVLKPDVGQRGTGVRIVRRLEEAAAYLDVVHTAVIVQPYHPGPCEAGVFYYRRPEWRTGRILCVTDKHFPVVVGDGASTLEELVWAHRRYRMQSRTFLARLGARRSRIPGAGERMSLGLAGNHAQGAMFTDGRHLITPQLEQRIDAIARRIDGFFIGRFDIRYANRDAFMAGRDLAIVELNGATAECTNIYDPRSTLIAAYRQLFLQWRLVFEIGAANRRAGCPATSPRRLRELLRTHLTTRAALPLSD